MEVLSAVVPKAENSLKPPKRGYTTIPAFDQLKKLSESQLRKVQDFTIMNDHGKVYFQGLTDLTDTDLAEVVSIGSNQIEVYPDSLKEQNRYPSLGHKLNRPAQLTFNKTFLTKLNTITAKIDRLKNMASQMDGVSQYVK